MKYLCKCAMNIFRLKILSFIPGNPWSDRQTTSDIKTIVIPLFTGFDCICVLDSLCFVVKKIFNYNKETALL